MFPIFQAWRTSTHYFKKSTSKPLFTFNITCKQNHFSTSKSTFSTPYFLICTPSNSKVNEVLKQPIKVNFVLIVCVRVFCARVLQHRSSKSNTTRIMVLTVYCRLETLLSHTKPSPLYETMWPHLYYCHSSLKP